MAEQTTKLFELEISQNSRLTQAEFIQLNGVSFWTLTDLPTIDKSDFDFTKLTHDADRIDLLTTFLFFDPVLWWAPAQFNEMRLLPFDLNSKERLKFPLLDNIKKAIRGS